MSEHDQEHDEQGEGADSNDEWVKEVEEDPSTAGSPEEPGDELRGG
jgi:hypothetical protein